MAILRVGGTAVDYELRLLKKILALLDMELSQVNAAIKQSQEPESDGLLDLGAFLIGSGFVAVQRYINSTRVDFGVSKKDAYDKPPMFNKNISTVAAINAIANYWKHCSDWDERERKGEDPSKQGSSQLTIQHLESLGDLNDYPCANALALMSLGKDLALSNLTSVLIEWREGLWAGRSGTAE